MGAYKLEGKRGCPSSTLGHVKYIFSKLHGFIELELASQTEKSYINSGILILIGLNVKCNTSAMLILTPFKMLKVFLSRTWMELTQECSEW